MKIIYNKAKRLQLIEGLKQYLDNPQYINSYFETSIVKATKISGIRNAVVQFEDKDGNIIDTDFSYSIEKLANQYVILPSASSDKAQCQKLLNELTDKLDTHRLLITTKISAGNASIYDPHMDDNF